MAGGFSTWWFLNVAHLPYVLAQFSPVSSSRTLCGLMLWYGIVLPLVAAAQPALRGAARHHRVRRDIERAGATADRADAANPAALAAGFLDHLPETSRIDGQYLVVVVLTLAIVAAITATLQFTSLGREMRACAASRDTSELLGISPEKMGMLSFAATGAIGGFAGAMITPAQFTSADVGLSYGVFGFVAAVLGGFGTMRGALVGGLLLGLVNALVGRYISSNYQSVIAFAMLLALLAVRPEGITGKSWEESET